MNFKGDKKFYPHEWAVSHSTDGVQLHLKDANTGAQFSITFDCWLDLYAFLNDASIEAIMKNDKVSGTPTKTYTPPY